MIAHSCCAILHAENHGSAYVGTATSRITRVGKLPDPAVDVGSDLIELSVLSRDQVLATLVAWCILRIVPDSPYHSLNVVPYVEVVGIASYVQHCDW